MDILSHSYTGEVDGGNRKIANRFPGTGQIFMIGWIIDARPPTCLGVVRYELTRGLAFGFDENTSCQWLVESGLKLRFRFIPKLHRRNMFRDVGMV